MGSIMKPSGIKWIGDIPVSWDMQRYKFLSTTLYGYPLASDLFTNDSSYLPIIRIRNITSGTVETYYAGDCPDKYIIHKGDVLVGMDGDFGVRRWNGPDAYLNQRCCRINGGEHILPDFLLYVLPGALNDLNAGTTAATVKHLLAPDIDNLSIPLPPLSEQQSIVNVLDRVCKHANDLIASKEKQLQQLSEYKKSLISECVCGRVPGVTTQDIAFKDGGNQWAKSIPDHWLCSRIKYFYDISLGKMLQPSKNAFTDTLERYLCAANLKWRGVDTSIQKEMWLSPVEKAKYLLKPGDVLIMEGGATAGTTCMYDGEFAPCYMQNSVNRCRTKDEKKALNRWLYYWSYHLYHQGYIDSLNNNPTFIHYTKEKVEAAPLVIPPITEQHAIIEYLDRECARVDAISDIISNEILELEQYKNSTIYEYVTGKRRV